MLSRGQFARAAGGVALALAAAVTVMGASLFVGSREIAPGHVWLAIAGALESPDATVVTTQRIPRTVLAALAGLALGGAGALVQGHTRNPLADPGIVGVNAGAAFLVAATVYVAGISHAAALMGAALAGAALATTLVIVVGMRGAGGHAAVTLVVFGTAFSAMLGALTTAMVLLDAHTLDVVRFWNAGTVAGRDLTMLPLAAILVAVGLAITAVHAPALTTLRLGDDLSHALGVRVRRTRILGIIAITLLCGTATALCGPIGFLGLVAPHVARRLVGTDYRWILPAAMLLGAALLVCADMIGRIVVPGSEIAAGIVMAALGAPLLRALARRRRLAAL